MQQDDEPKHTASHQTLTLLSMHFTSRREDWREKAQNKQLKEDAVQKIRKASQKDHYSQNSQIIIEISLTLVQFGVPLTPSLQQLRQCQSCLYTGHVQRAEQLL